MALGGIRAGEDHHNSRGPGGWPTQGACLPTPAALVEVLFLASSRQPGYQVQVLSCSFWGPYLPAFSQRCQVLIPKTCEY